MATGTTSNGTNTALARRQNAEKTVRDLLQRQRGEIATALPSHLKADRMIRVALTTIRQTPELLECTPISLIKCVMQAAALGLEPDPLLGRAYIVPFNDRKKGTKEATLIIGYKGLIDLARRSGEIISLQAHVVYEADTFHFEYGTSEQLVHKPAAVQDRGRITHAWGMARFKGGGCQYEVMDIWELNAVREQSRQGKFGPWQDHTAEMYRKTVIRRLAKFLPLSPQLASHLAGEEMVESGAAPSDVYVDEGGEVIDVESRVSTPPQSRSEALAGRLAGEDKPKDLGWVHGGQTEAGNNPQDGDDLDGPAEPGSEG